jgi:hypothetical protein
VVLAALAATAFSMAAARAPAAVPAEAITADLTLVLADLKDR